MLKYLELLLCHYCYVICLSYSSTRRFRLRSIDWIPSFKVAAAKGDRQCATMRVIGMEDRDAAQLQEVMLTIPSRTQKAPPSLRLQVLSVVDRPLHSI